MTGSETTFILGIPVPSADPFFLGTVGFHIACGLAAVISGVGAMLNRKGRGTHSRFGTIYFWSLFGVFVSMAILATIRWAEDYPLFILGSLAFASAFLGRAAIRRRMLRWHLVGMAASFILMLTAFYVDNGKNLPLWRELPPIAFWLLPSAVGLPLIAYYIFRLPMVKHGIRSEPWLPRQEFPV